jgi:hypothetical protein
MSDISIVVRLLHCSENCGDEYLRELTGKAANTIDRLTADNEKLRAALLVARKYVLVQSCELSLMPEDAARDLDVIDEALEEDDD